MAKDKDQGNEHGGEGLEDLRARVASLEAEVLPPEPPTPPEPIQQVPTFPYKPDIRWDKDGDGNKRATYMRCFGKNCDLVANANLPKIAGQWCGTRPRECETESRARLQQAGEEAYREQLKGEKRNEMRKAQAMKGKAAKKLAAQLAAELAAEEAEAEAE